LPESIIRMTQLKLLRISTNKIPADLIGRLEKNLPETKVES